MSRTSPQSARRSGRRLRTTIGITLTAGLAFGLAACSGGSETSGMDGDAVTMFTWVGSPDEKAQWQAYVDGAKLADPDVDVTFSGPAIGSYYTKLATQLRGSDAPCIVTLQNGQVPRFSTALEPLDELASDAGVDIAEYDTSMITQLSDDGSVYALPYDAEPMVLYYNKSLFAAAGVAEPEVGWTTDEFLEAARATTTDGVKGFAIAQGIGGVGLWMAANGESYVAEDGTADLSDPALAERFQFVVDLATTEGVAKPLEASGGSFPDIDEFSSGQAAMFINGTWDLTHQQEEIGADNLGVATIPSDDGTPRGSIAGTGFAVTKSCSDKPAAFAAIAAMTSAESQQSVAVSRKQVPARADSLDAWKGAVGEQAATVVAALTENGQVDPSATESDKISTLFTQYAVNAFSGASTVDEVLQQVSDGVSR